MRVAWLFAFLVTAALAAAPARAGDGARRPANPTATAEAERLIPLLRSDDPAARDAAAAAIVKIGAPALEPLEAELVRVEAPLLRIRALLAAIRPGAAPPGGAERWYEAKFREAARRVERGDHLAAVKLCDAILIVEPDCPIRDRIQALKIRAKELHLRISVIEARLIPKRVLVAPGEPIEVALEVKNVSNEPLELAPPDVPEGDVFGALELETFEANANGERMRSHEIQKIQTTVAARLGPGETWKTLLSLGPARPIGTGVLRRVTISGSIRSKVLVKKDERFDRFLPLFPVEVFVADRTRHALAAEPRRALQEAIVALRATHDEKDAHAQAERIFFAALLAPQAAREATIQDLGATLDAPDDPAAPAAIAALAALADRPLEYDRALWRAWLKRRGS